MASWLDQIYQQQLGRTPDDSGRDFWLGQYQSGGMSKGDIESAFARSNEASAYSRGQTVNNSDLSAVTNTINDNLTNLTSSFGNPAQAEDMASGFADMDNNFQVTRDEMGEGFNQTQAMMGQGFTDVQQGLSNTNDLMVDGFVGTNQNLTSGFDGTNENLTTGFDASQDAINTAQTDILQGQTNMSGFLSDLNTNMTGQYADLSQQNTTTQDQLAGFSSNFDDYVQQYGEDTVQATNERQDIQDGMVAGFSNTRGDLANISNVQGQQVTGTDLARRENFARFVQQTTPQQVVAGRNAARTITQSPNISMPIRAQMNMVGSAFDDAGNLIVTARDDAGNVINRSIDQTGNLNIRVFDPMGQLAGENNVNIPEAFQMVSNLQQRMQLPMA